MIWRTVIPSASALKLGTSRCRSTGWAAAGPVFADALRWRPGIADHPPDTLSAAAGGLRWHFVTPGKQTPAIVVADRPAVLPAIVALLIAAIVGDFLILSFGQNPGTVYRLLLEGTWGNAYGLGQVLYKATTLTFTALLA